MEHAVGHVISGTADVVAGRFRQRLSWVLAWGTILLAAFAFILGVVAAARSGDVRSIFTHQLLLPFSAAGFAVVGGFVSARRPANPVGWLFVTTGLMQAVVSVAGYVSTGRFGTDALIDLGTWLGMWLWIPAIFLPTYFVLMLFPDGRLLSPRWRLTAWLGTLGVIGTSAGVALHPGPLETWATPANPFGIASLAAPLAAVLTIGSVLAGLGVATAALALAVRYRRATGIERGQLKWLAYATVLLVATFIASTVIAALFAESRLALELSIIAMNLAVFFIALAAGMAILYHRLYDIDVLINRTLVYAALTVVVAVLYVAAVAFIGWLVHGEYDAVAAVMATGLVAVLFQPLRSRLQRGINRLLYGQRDEPVAVLAALGERLEHTSELNLVPLTLARTIAESLKLPYVALALVEPDGMRVAAEFGRPVADTVALPLIYQQQEIGELRVAPRDQRDALDPADRYLLETVVRQAGVALRGVQLTRDLRRSHLELLTSREEERRRLRRDLHDGLGPTLASLTLGLDAARNLVESQPDAASPLLLELREQVQTVIKDVRRLVYDLRPPALDDLGLVAALQEQARQYEQQGLRIDVHAVGTLPLLSAAVEVAAYRIVQEALTNVVRHAGARTSRVTLEVAPGTSVAAAEGAGPDAGRETGPGAGPRALLITIEDDGAGLPATIRPGVGLGSIRERANQLGGQFSVGPGRTGGTIVTATLPLLQGGP